MVPDALMHELPCGLHRSRVKQGTTSCHRCPRPALLQPSLTSALTARWTAQQAFATSLTDTSQALANHNNLEGNDPTISTVPWPKPPNTPPGQQTPTPPKPRVWIDPLPQAHLETGQYKHSHQQPDILREKGAEEKNDIIRLCQGPAPAPARPHKTPLQQQQQQQNRHQHQHQHPHQHVHQHAPRKRAPAPPKVYPDHFGTSKRIILEHGSFWNTEEPKAQRDCSLTPASRIILEHTLRRHHLLVKMRASYETSSKSKPRKSPKRAAQVSTSVSYETAFKHEYCASPK